MMKTQKALFAAGCFWGVQYYFDQVPGVVKTTVGYTGGHTENPTYDEVCTHTTGHAEATLIEFDPEKVSYKTLLLQFFRMHDPTQLNRQGPDIGDSYRSAIFYFDEEQHKEAVQVRNQQQEEIDKPIVTQIETAGPFYEAEPYHQKFTERTGIGMCHIPYAPVAGQSTK
ncbi:MAG TPA: peptide-methionine (S)-S-oxide reductase MsrA [Candidatus Saccharimonadales bacterium]